MRSDEMAGYLEAAGLKVERIAEREPYEFEYPTRRIYAFGNKKSEVSGKQEAVSSK